MSISQKQAIQPASISLLSASFHLLICPSLPAPLPQPISLACAVLTPSHSFLSFAHCIRARET